MLTPNDVYEALVEQVGEKIVSCFRWPRFNHSFHPLEAVSEEVLAFEVPSLECLILGGLKTHFGVGRVELLLRPHSARYLSLRTSAAETGNRFQMNAAEQKFLLEVRGDRTVAQLQRDCSLDALQAGQLMAALVVTREAVLGALVDQSTEVLKIIDPTLLWVDAEIYEKDLAKVKIEQGVEIRSQRFWLLAWLRRKAL